MLGADRLQGAAIAARIMLIISPVGEFVSSTPGNYLKAYDPDHLDGRGYFETTADLNEAKRLATSPRCLPAGNSKAQLDRIALTVPNRPLTAYTVNFEETP